MVQEKHNILLRHFLSDCTQLFEDLIAWTLMRTSKCTNKQVQGYWFSAQSICCNRMFPNPSVLSLPNLCTCLPI